MADAKVLARVLAAAGWGLLPITKRKGKEKEENHTTPQKPPIHPLRRSFFLSLHQ